MNVMTYILNFFGVLKRNGENCHLKRAVDTCPVVQRLLELDIYKQMTVLKMKALRVKRIALGIIAGDVALAIVQAWNFMVLYPSNPHRVLFCFVCMVVRSALIIGVCGLVIAMLSTAGERDKYNGQSK